MTDRERAVIRLNHAAQMTRARREIRALQWCAVGVVGMLILAALSVIR